MDKNASPCLDVSSDSLFPQPPGFLWSSSRLHTFVDYYVAGNFNTFSTSLCFFSQVFNKNFFIFTYYICQVNVVNGGGYIVTLAVCPSVSSL